DGARDQAALDQAVDGGGDGWLGKRQPPGQRGRPLVALGDQGQEAVLRQRQVRARPLDEAGEPGNGSGGVHVVSLSNCSTFEPSVQWAARYGRQWSVCEDGSVRRSRWSPHW